MNKIQIFLNSKKDNLARNGIYKFIATGYNKIVILDK